MKQNNYYLMVFKSKNQAIHLYTLLESKDMNIAQLVSTPCSLRAGCTYSIKIMHERHIKTIKQLAEDANIKNYQFYYAERIQGKINYRKLS